ncbi:MAG: hypothetical protein OXU51_16790 [Candidatus Poribacteria bacterium]|nr:hypothetical protein [Candidatus Poribacteria bacterium]
MLPLPVGGVLPLLGGVLPEGGVETVPPHVPEFVQLHGELQSDVQS